MNDLIQIVALLAATAGAVFLSFLLIRSIVDSRRERLRQRMAGEEEPGTLLLPEVVEPKTLGERIDRRFERLVTDTGNPLSVGQALGVLALAGTIGLAVPLLFGRDLPLIALGLALGMLLPLAFFMARRVRYRNWVQDQLPDAFFLMARSLRSGLNLEQAMTTVANYGTQPLAGEFKRVVDRVDLGLSVPAALQGMARRLNMIDFNILVTAVSLHRNVGGNLATLLERVATSVRDRNLFRGYFRAATALGRITAIAIAIAPIAIFIGYAIWQPEFIDRFTRTASGLRALAIAGLLEVLGTVWLFLLLRVDY